MNNLTQKGGGNRRRNRSKREWSIRTAASSNAAQNTLANDTPILPLIPGSETLNNLSIQPEIIPYQNGLRNNWPNTMDQLIFNNLDNTPVLQNPYMAFAKSAPMMYGVYPALAALAARSLYNNYYASGGKTKKRSLRKRQTRKRQ
jgi:hypothetical protein